MALFAYHIAAPVIRTRYSFAMYFCTCPNLRPRTLMQMLAKMHYLLQNKPDINLFRLPCNMIHLSLADHNYSAQSTAAERCLGVKQTAALCLNSIITRLSTSVIFDHAFLLRRSQLTDLGTLLMQVFECGPFPEISFQHDKCVSYPRFQSSGYLRPRKQKSVSAEQLYCRNY
jgi:hypothetical protein